MSQDPSLQTDPSERIPVKSRGKQHLTQLDTWVLVQDTRIRLDDKIDRLGERLEAKIDKLDHKIERLEDRVDALGEEMVVVRKEIIGLDAKIDRTTSELRNDIVELGSELRKEFTATLDRKLDRQTNFLGVMFVILGLVVTIAIGIVGWVIPAMR
ncbi:MAG: hypothetical protein ACRC46_14090 [Thermoguttaceae bacterium]